MPKINLLPKSVSELIAAGEVVERPASVIKELCENSIDAGATKLTVEIKNGGVTFMRVTDNGCGIFPEDVPIAFLRHATSKIKVGTDLDEIATLGFRGEALAAVSSVARVEMFTKPHEIDLGTRYVIEGGEELVFEEAGCADGTTITIRDIFFNTPARMKFLKKDVTEGNAVAAVMDRIALSNPCVAVKFIRDGKTAMSTSGNGKLADTAYSVCGKDYVSGAIEFSGEMGGVKVSGLVSKPFNCRPTKAGQYVFLNGRFVKSGTVAAAMEQAFKNSAMIGKFPYGIINLTVPFGAVDVNVHPAKTEVRFSDEKRIFDAVYYVVKSAIAKGDERPQMASTKKNNVFTVMTAEEYKQTAFAAPEKRYEAPIQSIPQRKTEFSVAAPTEFNLVKPPQRSAEVPEKKVPVFKEKPQEKSQKPIVIETKKEEIKTEAPVQQEVKAVDPEDRIILVGEAFRTYIIAQKGRELYFIDKHAAHERLLFEELKKHAERDKQYLLVSESISINKEDYDLITANLDELAKLGFEVEDFGNGSVLVRAVPSMLVKENVKDMISEIAESLRYAKTASVERMDDIYHRMACRAAVKAGNLTTPAECEKLAERILSDNDIMYCPHGRPVAIRITEKELEKQFGRIQ